MLVWLDASDVEEARRWGKRVLEEFVHARFRYAKPEVDATVYEGEIDEDARFVEGTELAKIPVCKVGEVPNWPEPWRHCRASGPPRRMDVND